MRRSQLNHAELCGKVLNMAKESKIKQLRLRHGLSQNGLGRKADLDRATIAAAESFKNVSDLTLSKIANVFEVAAGDIDERT